MTEDPVRVVACGEKRVAQECLDRLHDDPDVEVAAVFTDADDWEADLVAWAEDAGVPVHTDAPRDRLDELRAADPDLLFSLQYPRRIDGPVLSIPSIGAFNLHFSLLPKYRGCYPIAWVLWNGEDVAGATLHEMTENFDDGRIVAQTQVEIGHRTTAKELYGQITDAAVDLFAKALPSLKTGDYEARPQDPDEATYYDKDSIDFDVEKHVDWTEPVDAVHNRVRAFTFPPFQEPVSELRLPGADPGEVTVTGSAVAAGPGETDADPGRVVSAADEGPVHVAAGDGGLLEVGAVDGDPAGAYLARRADDPTRARFT